MNKLSLVGNKISQGERDKETIKNSLDSILKKNKKSILHEINDYKFFKFNLTELELELYHKGSDVFLTQSRGQETYYILTKENLLKSISE